MLLESTTLKACDSTQASIITYFKRFLGMKEEKIKRRRIEFLAKKTSPLINEQEETRIRGKQGFDVSAEITIMCCYFSYLPVFAEVYYFLLVLVFHKETY